MIFWIKLVLLSSFWVFGFSNPDGFLSLSCGGSSYTAVYNISWVSDNDYIETGNTTTVTYIEGTSTSTVPIRFFPNSQSRQCYKLPVRKKDLSSVLIRTTFVYRNYDSQNQPPAFRVSLGRSVTSTVDLRTKDPWIEELVWPVNKDSLSLCLLAVKGRGIPVISSLEELEAKRKERSQVVYERKKQLNKLRAKAEKVAEEKLGAQLEILAPVKY
ncbi:hypothetical protein F2Q70_00032115 [Brassica cretica]|uniref:Malectin-like domain-containing protein n=1 Tax=Brassica cretica TaxID=69181 RepID=A0A8S9FGI7_BRACR|nr:hypothetical protein F2Q70_00032115 [Brassica cretica]